MSNPEKMPDGVGPDGKMYGNDMPDGVNAEGKMAKQPGAFPKDAYVGADGQKHNHPPGAPDGMYILGNGEDAPYWNQQPAAEVLPGQAARGPVGMGSGGAVIIGPGKEVAIPESASEREERERKIHLGHLKQPESLDGIPRHRFDKNFLASIKLILKGVNPNWEAVSINIDHESQDTVRLYNLLKNLECREDAADRISSPLYKAHDDWTVEYQKQFAELMGFYSWRAHIAAGHEDADKLLRGDPEIIGWLENVYHIQLRGLLTPIKSPETTKA